MSENELVIRPAERSLGKFVLKRRECFLTLSFFSRKVNHWAGTAYFTIDPRWFAENAEDWRRWAKHFALTTNDALVADLWAWMTAIIDTESGDGNGTRYIPN